jgi:hypothetical protein
LTEVLTSFGFFTPQAVANWPLTEQPTFRNSLGIVTGTVERELPRMQMEVANLSCAGCHAGNTYDADGMPQRVAWLGLPNTSVDLDAYAAGVLDALRLGLDQQPRVFAAIKQLFPDVSDAELATLRKFLGPELRERIGAGSGDCHCAMAAPAARMGSKHSNCSFTCAPAQDFRIGRIDTRDRRTGPALVGAGRRNVHSPGRSALSGPCRRRSSRTGTHCGNGRVLQPAHAGAAPGSDARRGRAGQRSTRFPR